MNSDNPNDSLVFEVHPVDEAWMFAPEFYPDNFRQPKDRKLNRFGGGDGEGETVTTNKIKNREFHVSGVVLRGELKVFNRLLDYEGPVEVISPLVPQGGMECRLNGGEVGDLEGYDPLNEQWKVKYKLDLVATDTDEGDNSRNGIVTEIMADVPTPDKGSASGGGDYEK